MSENFLAPQLSRHYIETVWETLPAHVRPTFLLPVPALSQRLHCDITLATETFQHTGSFKFRAAYHLLSSIPHQHVIAASSGNFGQAIAYASKLLGKQATIVMPATSARVKIRAVESYGGQVDLIDVQQVSRATRVAQLMQQIPQAFQAHAYDDYRVVAGNSTLGKEVLSAANFDAVLVPVGGGGLSAGMIIARDYLQSRTEIIGAEPLVANDAARSLHSGSLVSNEQEPATIADGARTLSLGQLNWEILRRGMADIIAVPESFIRQALRAAFLSANLKVEPTGALAIGALLTDPARFTGKRVCCIVSGGNVDPALYAEILTAEES
ncbi:MAG: threonine/serine dehydratase [Ktedonobacteraceae bacterium]|nr:threonine/serine dehydratase [Ktedonobacteraceae bacterium]